MKLDANRNAKMMKTGSMFHHSSVGAVFWGCLVATAFTATTLLGCTNPLATEAQAMRAEAASPRLVLSDPDSAVIGNNGTFSFSEVTVNVPEVFALKIKNSGKRALAIDLPAITVTEGADTEVGTFSITADPPGSIGAGASASFEVCFAPSDTGIKTATVVIPSNDVSNPRFTFLLSGTGSDISMAAPAINSIAWTTASGVGSVSYSGSETITSRGLCWSSSMNPTTEDGHVEAGSGTGSFSCALSSLLPGTGYYVRAWAAMGTRTAYGASFYFTTASASAPTTASVSDINATTAVSGGTAIADSGVTVTARGVCWSTSPLPTIADSHTADGSGAGSFTSSLTGLSPATTYYVRAYSYATNVANIVYGEALSLKTVGYLSPNGGYVFYDKGSLSDGWRYIEAAPNDFSDTYAWGTDGVTVGNSTAIGAGNNNTYWMIVSRNSAAAAACDYFIYGGHDDWFLPTKDELNLMFHNLAQQSLGGTWNAWWYWSSSESGTYQAYLQKPSGESSTYLKSFAYYVRAAHYY